eukprot:TRINITY_DN1383_c0_g1_i2.p1 TRINITY_DN1383_c0_g1~~TRINITY_DN1383_c0_g1_i2.p1  ORF type:complete len:152 (+),score=11.31 TRINITY_DN1383_c0_g1_i2:258-713(+)
MRGFFAIGIEHASKPGNIGNLARTAHAFGASFVFTLGSRYNVKKAHSDTSDASNHLPWYDYENFGDLTLPRSCKVVGIELMDCSVPLPSFRHPLAAAYVLGPEGGSLSEELVERCDHIIRIPSQFCLNVATAGSRARRAQTTSLDSTTLVV